MQMFKVGDMVEDKIQYANGVKYRGRITEVLGGGWFTVLWDMGTYLSLIHISEPTRPY